MSDFDLEAFAKECDERRALGLIPQRRKSGLDSPTDEKGERLRLSSDLSSHGVPTKRARKAVAPIATSGASSGEKKHRRRRSEASRQRRREVSHAQRKATSIVRRTEESRARGVFATTRETLNGSLSFVPGEYLTRDSRCSEEVANFYQEHGLENLLVRVSAGVNISNPSGAEDGGKGVFASARISKGTWVCPYIGRMQGSACSKAKACQYDMQLRKGVFVCARKCRYDMGYLYGHAETEDRSTDRGLRKGAIRAEEPCPPNYGRYVNTLTKAQLDEGRKFNCRFVSLGGKSEEVFLEALRDIEVGEELLASYGPDFVVE